MSPNWTKPNPRTHICEWKHIRTLNADPRASIEQCKGCCRFVILTPQGARKPINRHLALLPLDELLSSYPSMSETEDSYPKGAPKPEPNDIVAVLMTEEMARRFEQRCLGHKTRGHTELAGPLLFQEDDTPTYIICGGQHEGECGVKEATRRILETYVPRGMTAGAACPSCHYDGVWHWHNKSTEFKCERCGTIVPLSHTSLGYSSCRSPTRSLT